MLIYVFIVNLSPGGMVYARLSSAKAQDVFLLGNLLYTFRLHGLSLVTNHAVKYATNNVSWAATRLPLLCGNRCGGVTSYGAGWRTSTPREGND